MCATRTSFGTSDSRAKGRKHTDFPAEEIGKPVGIVGRDRVPHRRPVGKLAAPRGHTGQTLEDAEVGSPVERVEIAEGWRENRIDQAEAATGEPGAGAKLAFHQPEPGVESCGLPLEHPGIEGGVKPSDVVQAF